MAHTILVADDSKTIRKIVEMALKASPYQIIEASSARATMEAIQRAPDVVLLDYFMPDGTGYDVCRALKSNGSTSHIPVVMMGGSFKNFDENLARQSGANAIISKPFKVDELLQALQTALTSGAQPAARPAAPSTSSSPSLPTPGAMGAPAPPPNPFSAGAQRGNISSPGMPPRPAAPNQSSPGLPAQGSQPRIPTPVPQRNTSAPAPVSQPGVDPVRPMTTPPTAANQGGGAGVDRAEIESMIRDEVQRAVREELPGLLRNVMGDLFQQKILPRLVKHSEERVNSMLNDTLAKRVQEQVRVELEQLLREE